MTENPAAVEALKLAREYIAASRQALFDCHVEPATGKVDELGAIGLAEDDAILAAIDAALAHQPPAAVQAKRLTSSSRKSS